jgi:hypothetical protein
VGGGGQRAIPAPSSERTPDPVRLMNAGKFLGAGLRVYASDRGWHICMYVCKHTHTHTHTVYIHIHTYICRERERERERERVREM